MKWKEPQEPWTGISASALLNRWAPCSRTTVRPATAPKRTIIGSGTVLSHESRSPFRFGPYRIFRIKTTVLFLRIKAILRELILIYSVFNCLCCFYISYFAVFHAAAQLIEQAPSKHQAEVRRLTEMNNTTLDKGEMSKERVEAFSDGVFAVALTLLILELHAPSVESHSSLTQYAAAIAPLIPKALSFTLTFIIICIHWINHHYLFRRLSHTPLGIVWLNNLFLLWVCFMPFPTAMLGDNPTDQFPILLYGVNQLLAGLTFFAFRVYALKYKLFVDAASAKAMGPKHSIPAVTMLALSLVFAFLDVYLSLICLLIVPLLYFVPHLIKPMNTHN
jgi:uncharacterized membrane protein